MKRFIVKCHADAGWTRQRSVALPSQLLAYLENVGAGSTSVECCKNLFGLVLTKPDWDIKMNRIVFDFGMFDPDEYKVTLSSWKNIVQDMNELGPIWGVHFDKPIPLFNNFRGSEGISETIFYDSKGHFFAMGDELYKIGESYWEAMIYVFTEPLPQLPVVMPER